MSAQSKDTVFLVIGGVVFLAATAGAFLLKTSQPPFTAPTSGRSYEATNLTIEPPVSRQWAEAPAQSAGDKWLFEVFTPPKIYYNEETKQFTVIPPVRAAAPAETVVEPPKPEFGLKLAKVEQPLFRLQLVGAVNFGPDARGTFSNSLTGDIIIATKGRKIADLNLEITDFVAERRRISVVGGSDVITEVITATVKDTVTGVETRLDARTRLPEGALTATLTTSEGGERVVKAGDTVTEGETVFQITDIVLDPPTVTVKKTTPDLPEGVTEVLTIAPPVVEQAAPPEVTPSAPAEGLDGFFPGF
jgi:hypothetical protein